MSCGETTRRVAGLLCGAAVWGTAFSFQPLRRASSLESALNAELLKSPRGGLQGKVVEQGVKVDQRGFPMGDPRSKGGTEQDLGLQVGPLMWRWPTPWPYPADFFDAEDDSSAVEWFAAHPNAEGGAFIDDAKRRSLEAHLERHLPPAAQTSRVLDLGAGRVTRLPLGYAAGEVVGVGASASSMASNPLLSSRSVVLDLNGDKSGAPILPFDDESFDAVVCTCAMEFFTKPRELFREVYRVLKPTGSVHLAFASKGTYSETQETVGGDPLGLEPREARYWKNYTDAQKMYVAGSFFQFSAGGWSQLKGFDLTPNAGAGAEEKKMGLAAVFRNPEEEKRVASSGGLFAVSCTKAPKPPTSASHLRRMAANLWEEHSLLPDEKRLCTERLNALYQQSSDPHDKEVVLEGSKMLGVIYTVLAPMEAILPVPIRAALAANLAPAFAEPSFNVEALSEALREGLGLSPPQEEFWKPMGNLTSDLIAEDKIWLLVDLVPWFGSLTSRETVIALPGLLNDAQAIIEAKLPGLALGDKQLLAVELAISDWLPEQADKANFLPWLRSFGASDLSSILKQRKAFTGSAKAAFSERNGL